MQRAFRPSRRSLPRRAAIAAAVWWLVGATAILASLALAVSRGAGASDDGPPDRRSSTSGKPLVFRAVDNVAVDRDDQDATNQQELSSAMAGNRVGRSSVFAEMSLAQPQSASRLLRQPVVLAAAEQADSAPPAPTPDFGLPAETMPSGPRVIQPRGPSVLPVDPRINSGGQMPGPYPMSPAPPSPPGGGPLGGGWPHDELRSHFAEPLVGASWENEPYHIDWFLGAIRGTEIVENRIDQNVGVIGGFRLGWDFNCSWGLETRLGFSSLEDQPEIAPLYGSADKVVLWDTSLLYYPWGDSRLRPYWSLGLGLSEFRFSDEFGNPIRRNLMAMPFGIGVKYRWHDWVTLRADVTDNLAFGSSGLETMNNVSFTTGMEFHFGGCHKNYWPWEPEGAR
jgi:hypothetical protein